MEQSSGTIGQVISSDDSVVADTGLGSDEVPWRLKSKENLLKEELVPLVPVLERSDVNGNSSLEPAAVVKLITYFRDEVDL